MPTPPSKPIIFISYAPADEPEKPVDGEVKWLSFVTGHLRAAEEIGALEIWTEPLAPGADLGPEAQRKLRACDVFAPLISTHSLAFGAVVGRQIAIVRERQSRGEGVALYPLVLTPTPETALDIENLRPPGGRPGGVTLAQFLPLSRVTKTRPSLEPVQIRPRCSGDSRME